MARLVKLPSGAVFREKLDLGTNYYRPKDMFGLDALAKTIDFADKVAKSEGVGALMTAGEKVYDEFSGGNTEEAVKTAAEGSDLLKKAAEARVGANTLQQDKGLLDSFGIQAKQPLPTEALATKNISAGSTQPYASQYAGDVTRGVGVPTSEDEQLARFRKLLEQRPDLAKLMKGPDTAPTATPATPAVSPTPKLTVAPDEETDSKYTKRPDETLSQFNERMAEERRQKFEAEQGVKAPAPAEAAAPQPSPAVPSLPKWANRPADYDERNFAPAAKEKLNRIRAALSDPASGLSAAEKTQLAQALVAREEQYYNDAKQAQPVAQGYTTSGVPQQAPMPPSGAGTSVAQAPTPAAPQGPVSRPPKATAASQTAEPVPAGQPGETPVAPVGEGTAVREKTTMPQAKQQVLDTIGQGLDFIQNEYARNAERAAATIDLSGYILGQEMPAVTQAEALNTLMGYAKQLEPKQPDGKPLNIPQKVSIEQLIGFAKQANTTAQQQQVLDAFAKNQITGMYAPTIASRLTGEYKKPWLKTILETFPSRSSPQAMHPVDAMYKLAGAAKTYQFGEKTQAEIEAGLPQAQAARTRAQAVAQGAMAQQYAEKATEIRELLQARRADLLARSNKAMDDFLKEKPKRGGGAGKPETIDQRLWIQTNVGPVEKALDATQAQKNSLDARRRELQGKIAEAQALASDTTPVPVRSQMYQKRAEAKAKLAGFQAELSAADAIYADLLNDEKQLVEKANQLREFAAVNIGRKQAKLYTKEEAEGKYQSPQLQKQEAEKKGAPQPALGEKTTGGTGRPTGGEQTTKQEAARKLKEQQDKKKAKKGGDLDI